MSNEKNPLPESRDAFSFCEGTRELLGTVQVFLSPIEGEYFLPSNVVIVAPSGDLGPNQAFRLNASGDAWDVVADYRRVMLYDIATARVVPNMLAFGDALPVGVTAVPPPIHSEQAPLRNVWDANAGAWREEPDYSRFVAFDKATGAAAPRLAPGEALPASLTLLQPPPVADHKTPLWHEVSASWELVDDYRGTTYWLADGSEHTIERLGEVPPADALNRSPAEVTSA